MADTNQENLDPLTSQSASASSLPDAQLAQKSFGAHYSSSTPDQLQPKSKVQMSTMSAHKDYPVINGNGFVSTIVQSSIPPRSGTPGLTLPTTSVPPYLHNNSIAETNTRSSSPVTNSNSSATAIASSNLQSRPGTPSLTLPTTGPPRQSQSNSIAQTSLQSISPAIGSNAGATGMPYNNLQSRPGTSNPSRPTTPALASCFDTQDRRSSAPNQPPPPYQSPYSRSAPFPNPNDGPYRGPSSVYGQNQSSGQPRSGTPAATPNAYAAAARYTKPMPQYGTPEYITWLQNLSQPAPRSAYLINPQSEPNDNTNRNGRLSPVSNVRNVLKVVSDIGFVPKKLRQLAGVMAGNPMINSVQVIHKLTDQIEELEMVLNDRDATIRQGEAEFTNMQASHHLEIKKAIQDTVRTAARPFPIPNAQQASDLKARDDKIAHLLAFIEDQSRRIRKVEAERDQTRDAQFEMEKKHVLELAAAQAALQNQGQSSHARKVQSEVNVYDPNQGNAQVPDEAQPFNLNQGFSEPRAIDQGGDFDLDALLPLQSPGQEPVEVFRQGVQFGAGNQHNFGGQQNSLQQPIMPGHPQGMLLQQELGFGQQRAIQNTGHWRSFQGAEDPFVAGSQGGNLFQSEAARHAKIVRDSFARQDSPGQHGHGHPAIQNRQVPGQVERPQRNAATPGGLQRVSSQNQCTTPQLQNSSGPSPAQRRSLTPGHRQRMPSQGPEAPGRNQDIPGNGQVQGQDQHKEATPKRQQPAQNVQCQGQVQVNGQAKPPTPNHKQQPAQNMQGQGQRNQASSTQTKPLQPKKKSQNKTDQQGSNEGQGNTSSQVAQHNAPAYQHKYNHGQPQYNRNNVQNSYQQNDQVNNQNGYQNGYHNPQVNQGQGGQNYGAPLVNTQQYLPGYFMQPPSGHLNQQPSMQYQGHPQDYPRGHPQGPHQGPPQGPPQGQYQRPSNTPSPQIRKRDASTQDEQPGRGGEVQTADGKISLDEHSRNLRRKIYGQMSNSEAYAAGFKRSF